jgi:apolipoprotein N-acyltransferase
MLAIDLRRPISAVAPERVQGGVALILVVVSAALYSAAFPPVSWAALAWIALAPFFFAVAEAPSVRRAALLGLAWGIALAVGVGWPLPGMLIRYFAQPAWIAAAISVGVAVGLSGVFYAAFAAWLAWVARGRAVGPLLAAMAFTACEFARGRLIAANPWGLAAYSQTSSAWALPVVQTADLAGPYGIGFLIAGVNAALAASWTPALRGRRWRLTLAVLALLLLGAWGYGWLRLSDPFASGEAIRVAVVQPGATRDFAWRPEYATELPMQLIEQSRAPSVRDAEIVVWPENSVSFYLQEDTPQRRSLLEASETSKRDLVLGGPAYAYGVREVEYFNSIYLVRGGRLGGRYDKLRLVPLAERDDLRGVLPRAQSLTPGHDATLLRSGRAKLGAFLCFEAMYPETVRRFVDGGAELLVNLSNDVWFGVAAGAEMHLAMARLRAVEARRWLVRAATTGVSAIVDPHGRLRGRSEYGTPAVVAGEVHREVVSTFYERRGDAFAWTDLIVVLVVTLRYAVKSVRSRSGPQSAAARSPEPEQEESRR